MTVDHAGDRFVLLTSKVLLFLLILALCNLTAGTADGVRYSLQTEIWLSDLSEPEDIVSTPDGQLLIACRQGEVWLVAPDASQTETVLLLQLSNLDTDHGNGLLGIALDPDFALNGYLYLYYTAASPFKDRLSRFRVQKKAALLESETVLWEDSVAPGPYHHGGSIAFGPDGKLYIAIGDHSNPNDAQSLQSYHGKILRMERDGTIPNDNPFFDGDGPNLDAIWAYGLKNPTRISFDPLKGGMSISDFEERTELAGIDELNLGTAGANFGWPICEGKCRITGVTDPVYSFARERADALLTGGFVYRGNQFPREYYGHYLLGDYARKAIRSLALETEKLALNPDIDLEDLPQFNGQAKELREGPDGSLYYLVSAETGTGVLYRIRYVSENKPPVAIAIESASAGLAPLTVRFSSLGSRDPEGQPVTYHWEFGDGTTSTVANPAHTYPKKGVYVVTLSVSDGTYVSSSRPIRIQVAEYGSGRASKIGIVSPAGLPQRASTLSDSTTRIANGGFALRFYGNGTNDIDRVKIPIDAPSRPVDVGLDFTLEFWMQAHPTANSSTPISPGSDNWINGNIIFDRDIYGTGDYGDFGISLAGYRIAFGVDSLGSGNTIYGSTQLNDSAWHHIAVTREASSGLLRIFVDGVLDASGVGPTGDIRYRDGRSSWFPNSDPYLVIGAEKLDAGPGYPSYNGVIDEVRISSTVRYTTNFTRPAAPFVTDANTVALYHFNEGSGILAFDVSEASGGPSNGELRIGGLPQGPEWVLSDAPLGGGGNQPPSVNAGADQSVTLPNAANLAGTVTDDGLPNPPGAVTTTWSRVSGPGTVTFGNSAAVDTTATFSMAGTYVLRLTANDGALSASDDITITVTAQNQSPLVNSGVDQSVTLPNTANLDGTVTDDGLPNPPGAVTTTWSPVSGPGTVTFGNTSALDTTASFSVAGTYVLRLTANDGALSASDDITITVTAQNQSPSVNAGADQSVTLPNAANLDGTVTDDGLPNPPGAVSTTWSRVSGPGTVTFGNSAAVDTTATFSMAGTYVLRLAANDGSLSASDDVTITVSPSGLLSVAAYALNEGFGTTTADASGNGNNATLFGPSWTTGRFGNGLSFDGADDYVSIADHNSLDITAELTLEAWIYPSALNSYRMIIAKTTTGEPSNYYLGTVGDELSFGFYSNGWREHTTASVNLQINGWHHVAVVFNDAANSVRLYVNGLEVLSSSEMNSLTVNNETLRIGVGFPNEVFNGIIDEVRIYNRALSQEEIQADMNRATAP